MTDLEEEPKTMTDLEKVKNIVDAGIESSKDDDDMLVEIISSGITFKNAGKLFNQVMEESGYRITAKKRKEECRKILLENEFQPADYETLQLMVEHLAAKVSDTTPDQAYSCMRAYAREFEVELPKPPKAPRGGLQVRAQEWMVANPESSKDDLAIWIEDVAKKDDPEGKVLEKFWKLFEFGKQMRSA